MKITHLLIRNFRSIRELEIEVQPLMMLLGPNNSGKSNILRALNVFFNTAARFVGEDDFRLCKGSREDEMVIEATFDNLSKQDQTTFSRYVGRGNKLRVRKTISIGGNGIEQQYQGYRELPGKEYPWLQPEKAKEYASRAKLQEIDPKFDVMRYFPPSGRITIAMVEDFQVQYINEHRSELTLEEKLEPGPLLGDKNFAQGILGDFYWIPAVRDLADETKIQTGTSFGQIVTAVLEEMALSSEEFQAIKEQLQVLVSSLNRDVEGSDEGRPARLLQLERQLSEHLAPWQATLDIEVEPPDIENVFRLGTSVFVDDGVRTLAEAKGHGLQRHLIFSLLRVWADMLNDMRAVEASLKDEGRTRARARSGSLFFGVEEPELYLHPQGQRRMMGTLLQLSQGQQVFVTTHSSCFVDIDLWNSICIVTKKDPTTGTEVRQCTCDPFEDLDEEKTKKAKKAFNLAYWCNPDRNELFFARKVALVEGQTEKAVFPCLAEKMDVYDHEVTLIDCGGKQNIRSYVSMLNGFGIEYIVIHDKDGESQEENERIANLVDPQIGQVIVLEPKFEVVAGLPEISSRNKAYKAMVCLEPEDVPVPPGLVGFVKAIYAK